MDGLYLTDNYLPPEMCEEILNSIDKGTWRNDLDRRTQHYGVRYDYKSKKLMSDVEEIKGSVIENCIELLNPTFQYLSGGLNIENVIVNEYKSNQRISAHTDSNKFGPVVMTLTLGDTTDMIFTKNHEKFTVSLKSGTVVALTGSSRYEWKHETKSVSDKNFRRVSVTVRSVNK